MVKLHKMCDWPITARKKICLYSNNKYARKSGSKEGTTAVLSAKEGHAGPSESPELQEEAESKAGDSFWTKEDNKQRDQG